jgi:hypothetical protein
MLAVAAAAVMFLHCVPAGGSDLAMEAAGVAADAAMGAIGGLATTLRRSADARPPGRAGWLAASTWVGGVGARLALAIAASNGAGPAIARFSVAHHITGSAAWVAALVMMALTDLLTQLVVIYLRGRQLAAAPAARPASRQPPDLTRGSAAALVMAPAQHGSPRGSGRRRSVPRPGMAEARARATTARMPTVPNPWPLLLHRGYER